MGEQPNGSSQFGATTTTGFWAIPAPPGIQDRDGNETPRRLTVLDLAITPGGELAPWNSICQQCV